MELLTVLAKNKDLGMAILVITAMGFMVKVFLTHIKEENQLSRATHKEISNNSTGALKEVTAAITKLHESNQTSHENIANHNERIFEAVKETKKRVEEIHYQIKK